LQCIAIDSSNTVWVGGPDAAYRYHWLTEWVRIDSVLDLENETVAVTDIEVTPNGSIWLGKYKTTNIHEGERLYLKENEDWMGMPFDFGLTVPIRIHIENDSLIYLTLQNYWNNLIFYDEIGIIKNGEFARFRPDTVFGINSVIPYSSDTLMVTNWRGVSFCVGDTSVVHNPPFEEYANTQPTLNKVGKRIFVYNEQLFEFKENEYISFPKVDSLLLEDSSIITCMTVESDSIIWLGTNKGGLIKYYNNLVYQELTVYNEIMDIAIYYENFGSWSAKWKCFITTDGCYFMNEYIHIDVEEDIDSHQPYVFSLKHNYPNPFNPNTKINYSIPSQSFVTLKVFDVLGRELRTLINKEQPLGNYEVEFNASGLTSGIYFYRIQAGQFVDTKKMLLVK